MTESQWRDAVLDKVEHLAGAESKAELAATWEEHGARDKVEITFLGPYSSGKSSVLRRLVVDAGLDIPEWLTVAARRETFELNEIDVGAVTFTDAPGFAAGNELHDHLAQDALALSDAFLIVVPPQLLTSNRELVGSILAGRYFFGEPGGAVDRAAIAVVAQADTMGIDPEDDVDGMRELAARKRSELVQQLEDVAGRELPGLLVLSVAADPYEEQARTAHPERSDFDPYREWDGIDALGEALASLPERKQELRRSACVRYFAGVGREVLDQASELVEDLRASAEEMQARQTSWSQLKARVEAVIEAAKADLSTALIDLADDLSEELGTDEEKSRPAIDARMGVTLERWAQRWDGELDLLLGEGGLEIDRRLDRSRAKRTEEFLRSLSSTPGTIGAPEPNSRVVRLLNDVQGHLSGLARHSFELFAGETIEHLLEGGKRAAQTKAAVDQAKAVSKKAAKGAQKLQATIEIAETVITIITILDAERQQHLLEAEIRRQRDEARDRIERNAVVVSAQIVDGTPGEPGWRARADADLHGLLERLSLPEDETAIDALLQDVATREQHIAEFRELLAQGPSLIE